MPKKQKAQPRAATRVFFQLPDLFNSPFLHLRRSKVQNNPNSVFPAPRCSTGGAVSPPRSTGSRPFPSQVRGSQSVAELIRPKIAGGTGAASRFRAAPRGRGRGGTSGAAAFARPPGESGLQVRAGGGRARLPSHPRARSVTHSPGARADPAAGAGSGERPRQGPLSGGSDAARGCRDLSEHAAGGRGLRSC